MPTIDVSRRELQEISDDDYDEWDGGEQARGVRAMEGASARAPRQREAMAQAQERSVDDVVIIIIDGHLAHEGERADLILVSREMEQADALISLALCFSPLFLGHLP